MCERLGSLAVPPFEAAERLTVPDPKRTCPETQYPAEAESQPKLARELYCSDLEQINQYALHVTSAHAYALSR